MSGQGVGAVDGGECASANQYSVPMPDGNRAMVDSFFGAELTVVTSKGPIRFEFSEFFGPMPVTATGAERELEPRHPFWRAASLWRLQGARAEGGQAIWREPAKLVLEHIAGRHWRVIVDGEPGHDW